MLSGLNTKDTVATRSSHSSWPVATTDRKARSMGIGASAQICLRVAPEERDLINEQARLAKISQQRLLRIRIGLPERPDADLAREMLAQLRAEQRTVFSS